MTKKYTLHLPSTSFKERIIFEDQQKSILDHWEENNLKTIRKEKQKKYIKKFILHLGPPYATGDLHKGHLLNSILKNFAIRSHENLDFQVEARQGWDCHGLPIEMKVEALKKNPQDPLYSLVIDENSQENPIINFRKSCKKFAEYWINIQKESLKILGFAGDLDNYYTTMEKSSQLSIIGGFLKLITKNWVYRKKKVSMWSTVEKTTLSDAEIQYKDDHTSTSVYFVSRITKCPLLPALENNFITIWTTTPWTLPGNNGYAYHNDLTYQWIRWGMFMFIAEKSLVQDICKKILFHHNIETDHTPEVLLEFQGNQLAGSLAEHPIWKHDVPMVHGDFVGGVDENGHRIGEKGTGIVHIAGAHGIDDFNLSILHNMDIRDWLDENGFYIKDMADLGGLNCLKDPQPVIDLLGTKLLVQEKYSHRYPYSERGKNPIIFKLSYQWFIEIDNSQIRCKSMEAAEKVHWIPSTGKNRMEGMLKTRKEWVLSRQRYWGTPITWFYHKITGDILPYDDEYGPKIVANIMKLIDDKSYDYWYEKDNATLAQQLLPSHWAHDYIPCRDIMDVWFESGMSHDYVVRHGDKNIIPDLYIEGSDQHRGWFQSSLLSSIGLYDNAPYKTVLTHGFVLDEKRQKMSKSLGNVISLRDCCNKIGSDVMNIWVAMADFTEEICFSEHIINIAKDMYNSIRNRCKFLLAVLNGNDDHWHPLDNDLLSPLDEYILAKIYDTHHKINEKLSQYDFRHSFMMFNEFCNEDLSKIYFIYIKDILYCDSVDNPRRKNILKIINRILKFIIHHGKVFLPFLMEEVNIIYQKENKETCLSPSVFGLDNFKPEESWNNPSALKNMEIYLEEANKIMTIVENGIKNGVIKNKSEAQVKFSTENSGILLELCKIAAIVNEGPEITVTSKKKCDRCWNYVIVNDDILCPRCYDVESK
jgi:isoleucyl-tRNA synthetase